MSETGPFNTNSDAIWFAGSFLIGFVLLLILRWPTLLNQSAILAAIVLCCVILIYALIIWHWGRFRFRRDDRAADNLYFLGFMFTVCALGISLYRYSILDDGRVALIIGDLGIGIATTVIGLFLRVLFLQREDPADIEDRVHRELIDVANSTLDRIRETSSIIEQGQILTRQVIDELNSTTTHSTNELTNRLRELDEKIGKVDIPQDLIVSQLDPVLKQTANSVSSFADQLDKLRVPADLITQRLDQALTAVKETTPVLIREVVTGLENEISDILRDIRVNIETTATHMKQGVDSQITKLELPTELIHLRVNDALDRFNDSTERLTKGVNKLNEGVVETERLIAELPVPFVSTFDSFVERIVSVLDQLEGRVSRFGQGLDVLDTSEIRETIVSVVSVINQSENALKQQHSIFTEQTNQLAELTVQTQSLIESQIRVLSDISESSHEPIDRVGRTGVDAAATPQRWWSWKSKGK